MWGKEACTHDSNPLAGSPSCVFDDIEQDGQAAVAEARRRAKRFIAKWQPLYPSAVACVADNLDALVVHLRFPTEHRKRIRHSNLIERTFGDYAEQVIMPRSLLGASLSLLTGLSAGRYSA